MGGCDRIEIEIDRTACRGAGECVFRAERTFALDGDGHAKLISPDTATDPTDEQVVLAAARACPNFAISVRRGGCRLV